MNITHVITARGEPTALLTMMERFNEACNWLSGIAFHERIFHWLPLQRRAYHELRREFGLTSNEAIVAIRKVAEAYKMKGRRQSRVSFRSRGGIPIYRHSYRADGTVRIYGHAIPFRARPGITLPRNPSQGVLIYRDQRFFIQQPLEVQTPPLKSVSEHLGVDLGIVNLAADSTGEVHTGAQVNEKRRVFSHRRRNLQRKGTRSAKRKLQRIRRKQGRYQRDVNHCISKAVVQKAQGHSWGIALEDLQGIQERTVVRRRQRARHHNWAFGQLRTFIKYKAAQNGIPVVLVNPRNTSKMCPECGFTDKRNRPSQAEFKCRSCRYSAPADYAAARNIRARAASDQPMVAATSNAVEDKASDKGL